MKKVFKIGCIGVIVLFVIAIVIGVLEEKSEGPRQSFEIINTSDQPLNTTFELINEDDTPSNIWYISETVQPNDFFIDRIPEGKYKIIIWKSDKHEEMLRKTYFEFKLENSEKSNYSLYRFDMAMDKTFVLLYLNALYEGNAFAEHMSNAVGNSANTIKVTEFYDGSKPFLIPDTYTYNSEFIEYNDSELPDEIRYGDRLYGLFYFDSELNNEEIYENINQAVLNRFEDEL